MTDTIRATLKYSLDRDIVLNKPGTDPRTVDILDAWSQQSTLSIDKQGFELHEFKSDFKDFDHGVDVKQIFYQQVIDFVKLHTGAKQVVVVAHTIRKRRPENLKNQREIFRPAVLLVHGDYTHISGPLKLKKFLPELLSQGHVAFYNVWKPLYNRVEELPLAMCDATSYGINDICSVNITNQDPMHNFYVMQYSSDHKWIYFPGMDANQALILKMYDSNYDKSCRFLMHSAFEHPNTPTNALKRESIEVRTIAFF